MANVPIVEGALAVRASRKFSEELHILSPRHRRIERLVAGFYTDERASDRQSTHALDKAYQRREVENGCHLASPAA
jgi:hypothetical protein